MSPAVHPLAAAREAAGLSQLDLARAANCTQPAVSFIEQGVTRMPHHSTLDRLALAVGVDRDELEQKIVAHNQERRAEQAATQKEAA